MIYRVCSSLLESCVVIRAVFFQHTLGSQQQRDFMNTQPGMIAALANQSMVIAHHEVCMKINGFKTYETNSVNEIIQPTHDYKYFKFENLLETAEYKNTLKSICEKRFTMFFDQLEQRPECSTDIEFYLGNYSIDCELYFSRRFLFSVQR